MPGMATTVDHLLDGRVVLRQPAKGFRAAIDPVLLAAAVAALPGERALELGAGIGAAALCLARRVPDVVVHGVDRDADLVTLARGNAAANGLAGRVRFSAADIDGPDIPEAGTWDHVFANPPYLARDGADTRRAGAPAATVEGEGGLGVWIAAMRRAVRRRGRIVLVHRADRLADIVVALSDGFGEISVFPLWPHDGAPARRVLVGARAGVKGSLTLLPGLILHRPDGNWTAGADAVLRDGTPLDLGRPQGIAARKRASRGVGP
ncbi:MAG: methyltransferase [Alphaproteobacteria bacterium]|nr:methyltransferase [Alphaproteobacteria bacterium]